MMIKKEFHFLYIPPTLPVFSSGFVLFIQKVVKFKNDWKGNNQSDPILFIPMIENIEFLFYTMLTLCRKTLIPSHILIQKDCSCNLHNIFPI